MIASTAIVIAPAILIAAAISEAVLLLQWSLRDKSGVSRSYVIEAAVNEAQLH